MRQRGHELFEHTADVGIRAWGPTLADAFAEAVVGLVGNMVELARAGADEERRIEVAAESPARLLFALLDEVLFVVQTDLWVPREVDVRLEGEGRAVATMRGAPYDPATHGHIHEVKAITYHDLEVRAEPPEVSVIVDI